MYITTPCESCVGKPICMRRKENEVVINSEYKQEILDAPVTLHACVMCSSHNYVSSTYTSCSSVDSYNCEIAYHKGPPKCNECVYNLFCSVDKEKQEALCRALENKLFGDILFNCQSFVQR